MCPRAMIDASHSKPICLSADWSNRVERLVVYWSASSGVVTLWGALSLTLTLGQGLAIENSRH